MVWCLYYRTVGRGGGSVGGFGFLVGSILVAAGAAKRAISAATGGKRAYVAAKAAKHAVIACEISAAMGGKRAFDSALCGFVKRNPRQSEKWQKGVSLSRSSRPLGGCCANLDRLPSFCKGLEAARVEGIFAPYVCFVHSPTLRPPSRAGTRLTG